MSSNPQVPMANPTPAPEIKPEVAVEPVFNGSHTTKEIEEYQNSKKESETK